MLIMIDGPMISRFIDDESFRKYSDDRFHELDQDRDGLILRNDLKWECSDSMALDHQELKNNDAREDKDVSIDQEVFRSMMTEILTAIARGLGTMPVIIGLEKDSMLMKAYETELTRIDRKLDEVLSV